MHATRCWAYTKACSCRLAVAFGGMHQKAMWLLREVLLIFSLLVCQPAHCGRGASGRTNGTG